jgi:hypothetical protein
VISFVDIAGRMDEAATIGSLRELAARHRWLGEGPPPEISLARLAARHLHPTTSRHRLLWYNTYLIHGFELTLCNLVMLGRLLEEAGESAHDVVIDLALDPLELVDRMGVGSGAFGYTKSQLEAAFPDLVSGLLDTIISIGSGGTLSLSDILDALDARDIVEKFGLSVEDILDKTGLDPLAILLEYCDLALAYLSSLPGMPQLTATWYVTGDAPDRPARAKEIGTMVGNEYHVAALCEAFEPDRQDDLQARAEASGGAVEVAKGAAADGELAGSGLMTLALGGRLVSSERMEFSDQGDRLRDADAWSRKGVLRTVLDLGDDRRVELYSTHLFNGGGILEFDPANPHEATLAAKFPKLTPDERLAIQLKQVGEAVQYVNDTHKADHVAILVGDFNIDANTPADYTKLVGVMAKANLVDLWPFWAQRTGPSMKALKPRGDTIHPEDVCIDADSDFCEEPKQPDDHKRSRIDFIWIERPKASHSFVLDIARPRRRPFARKPPVGGHLSDHLGLDFTLIASPIIHVPADPSPNP